HRTMAAPADHRPGLYGVEPKEAALEIRAGAAPSAKRLVERRLLPISGVVVATRRIGLPNLHQRVFERRADTIEHAPFDADPLPGRIGTDKHVGEVLVEYGEASLMRDQADKNVSTRRLGWRLGQIFERLHHVLIPMQLVLEQR